MRLADAARLLAAAHDAGALVALVQALGFADAPIAVGRDAAASLARYGVRGARVLEGRGPPRALLGEATDARPVRETLAAVARHLAAVAPAQRWLVALAREDGSEVALAVCRVERSERVPRIAALVADPRRVLTSDAETLCALATGAPDRWHELLGREALSRRFYRQLETAVRALADTASGLDDGAARAEIALLYVSRLLFLAFVEAKGWLDGDHGFLRRTYDACRATGGRYHERVLRPLFFGTLNTPPRRRAGAARAFGRIPFLNGGLFAPTPTERRHRALRLDDDALGTVVVGLLGRHRFTAREESGAYSEAAVDPEMLGRAFESLMGADARRATGAFYTPQPLVEHVTAEALGAALGRDDPAVDRLLAGGRLEGAAADAVRDRIAALRVLDPACGSGAFLVHAMERLADLVGRCGDARPTAVRRRDVLARSVFGVDVNPTAVWLCELRLWLSVVVESDEPDPMCVAPLPNLDRHVRLGDSLAAPSWARGWGGDPWARVERATRRGERSTAQSLRARYVRASGRRKVTLGAALERVEREAAVDALDRVLGARRAERGALLVAARGRDLFGARRGSDAAERRRLDALRAECRELAARRRAVARGGALPFGFAWHFPDLAASRGCGVVLGNPPWVRPHALGAGERRALRAAYDTCRDAAWSPGASAAGAGRGFGGQADLAAPFLERSLALVRPGGIVALLVPAKLWRALAGGGVRRLLAREARVRVVEDWSDAPAAFDAAVYPSLVVAERAWSVERGAKSEQSRSTLHAPRSTLTVRVHDASSAREWPVDATRLPLDDTPGSPWLLVPPAVRDAIARLRAAGVPLGEAGLGRVRLGVKCGCNDAFLVRVVDEDGDVAHVDGVWPDGRARHGVVERALLRPAARGETLHDAADAARERLLWPHDATGRPLGALPPHAARWLAPWRAALAARSDARSGRGPWWALFRTAAAVGAMPRVVWADVARTLRPRLLRAGDPTVPLNSCYVLQCTPTDAAPLTTLLGSPVAAGWCAALAEPARGGYRRHLAWTVALLPVPRDWTAARRLLARDGSMAAVAAAYGLAAETLAPLAVHPD
ncbi:hypothetical protein J421_4374 [Gemmatirosa kalamazoonensis]|uniref:site-specific DNA-methyltransferase (adenine-specific) n=1 Tax=Gemmatirosa kalamazoonensis TaxID=861299 RepID=W0RMB9_9BACT|nr:DNA methyltransferase [Gemmatirosa kalamazoonensis]AHG91911.1 hypothetical protein J421_4374 [Gemmatirosa kalamazoonensis]